MYEYPDSAYGILSTMIPPFGNRSQEATWAILMTQAKYKLYIPQNDSLLNVASLFYLNGKDKQKKALTWYLKAVLYIEENQIEDAQQCLLQAAEQVTHTKDYQLGHLIYDELGNIYTIRGLNEYIKDANDKSLEYAQKSHNQKYIMSAYQSIARRHRCFKQHKKEIGYYERAINIAQQNSWFENEANLMTEMANSYALSGDTLESIHLIKRAIETSNKHSIEITPQQYYTIGELYRKTKNDSASYYLSMALKNSDIYNQMNTNNSLYRLYYEKKDYVKAIRYLENTTLLLDSIQKSEKRKALIEMKQKYDQQGIIHEKKMVEKDRDMLVNKILLLFILSICIITIIVAINQRNLRKKCMLVKEAENRARKMALELQTNKTIIRQNQLHIEELSKQIGNQSDMQEQIEDKTSIIEELSSQNKALESMNRKLKEEIETYMGNLNIKNNELDKMMELPDIIEKQLNRIHYLENQLADRNATIRTIKDNPKHFDKTEWSELYDAINLIYNNFTGRLKDRIPSLTEAELNLCCLIKLQLSNKDIATVLAISVWSVPKYKQRLKSRMSNNVQPIEGKKSLDVWIWDF
jgi:tetratricopeptide (TPR) repeat protein